MQLEDVYEVLVVIICCAREVISTSVLVNMQIAIRKVCPVWVFELRWIVSDTDLFLVELEPWPNDGSVVWLLSLWTFLTFVRDAYTMLVELNLVLASGWSGDDCWLRDWLICFGFFVGGVS